MTPIEHTYGTVVNLNKKPLRHIGDTVAEWAHDLWSLTLTVISDTEHFTVIYNDTLRIELSQEGSLLHILILDGDAHINGEELFTRFVSSPFFCRVSLHYPHAKTTRELLS